MGPYYRGTSQGVGTFFDSIYQHPLLTLVLLIALAAVAFLLWRKFKPDHPTHF